MTFFDALKRDRGYELAFGDEKAIVLFIMKVYHDFKRTRLVLAHVQLSRQSDLSLTQQVSYVAFHSMRKSGGRQDPWSIDFALDQLSTRGHDARLGWINKPDQNDLTYAN
jgi:hypothetical protein